MKNIDVQEIELNLLLEAVVQVYGYDFRCYARQSLKRRASSFLEKSNFETYSSLQGEIMRNKILFNDFLLELSINVTGMFRDPEFYSGFKQNILPTLRSYPFIKIWHAGCSTGQEVYSMAILLHEAGLLDRTTLYATDFNNQALQIAKDGIYPTEDIKEYTKNYNAAQCQGSFSDYYHADYGSVKIRDFLKSKIAFANHNLVTDSVFGEMNVILCRNVMIYFDSNLQTKVCNLFYQSLCHRGFLCLGNKESLSKQLLDESFDHVSRSDRIYRKKQ